ncbi:MAG: mechanosensitive ion channel family protein [Gammaproteobacteria bacterium]|nr:mechanosensitive ion channel family protein [Gammaproteobacteria bacterium]
MMDFGLPVWLGVPTERWLAAAAILVATIIGVRLVVRFVRHRMAAWATRTETHIDDILAAGLKATRSWFSIAVGALAAVQVLDLPQGVEAAIERGAVVLILLQAALWGHSAIGAALSRIGRPATPDAAALATSASAVAFVVRVAFWSVILLLILANLGFDVTAIIAGLGVGGIAVALAVQNILGDLFASLAIALDKPVVIGDFVVVGEFAGTVEHIGLKTTQLRSISGEQIILSNSDLLNSRIRNYKRMRERRVVLEIGVTYETPREKLRVIAGMLREIISADESARFDRAHLRGFGPFSIDFEIVYYVRSPEYNVFMDTQQRVALSVIDLFAEHEIEFAYPTQTIHMAGGAVSSA